MSPAARPSPRKPLGTVTRGTTNPNRLRRIDRWLIASYGAALSRFEDPLVIDLGYGAVPTTTVELAGRLWDRVDPGVRVIGMEIDPARVTLAQELAQDSAEPGRLEFALGGFDLAGHRPHVVRAFNVLRQYPLDEAAAAWVELTSRLAPSGVLIEGTCNEIGRRATWVTLTADGPQTLTLACDTADIDRPSDLAERLPKALIHHNVAGQPIHALLRDLDVAWASAAPMSTFGSRQRWSAMAKQVALAGWSAPGTASRWRYGEFTVPWRRLVRT